MGLLQFTLGFTLSITVLMTTACSEKKSSPKAIPRSNEVTAANYLSGKAFCNKYSDITKKEYGMYVQVPVDYQDTKKGMTEVYAWTNKPFNPNLKTFIYLEGGPGGNSHGSKDFLKVSEEIFPQHTSMDSQWNQINIDQRGLGCSAPATFELYKDITFYSSLNTTLDMEAVRKAYGISKWTVYGISYGTVPATIYASKFPKSTRSVVLEGVVSSSKELSNEDFNTDKVNQILSLLNSNQKENFKKLYKDEKYQSILGSVFSYTMYHNGGYKKFRDFILAVIPQDGSINYQAIHEVGHNLSAYEEAQSSPQSPGNVDEQFFSVLYCKELNLSGTQKRSYFDEQSFKFYTTSYEYDQEDCENLGVTKDKIQRYSAVDYPVTVHVAYFQGSHDGATPVVGAVAHWMSTPRASSQMLISTRGGHSPMAERLTYIDDEDEKPTEQEKQKSLLLINLSQMAFTTALNGEMIPDRIIGAINLQLPADEQWLSPDKSTAGLKKIEEAARYINRSRKAL